MSHEVEAMAFKGETPWHGLGELVNEIKELPACLQWEVLKKVLYFPNGAPDYIQADNFRALVRSTDAKVLGVVTDDYVPHQNAETWDVFKGFADAGQMSIETAGSLREGRIIWALAKIQKDFILSGAAGRDATELYALMATSHDGSMRTLFAPTAVRVVCMNTLRLALGRANGKSYGQTHRSEFDAAKAKDFVASAILGFEDYAAQAERMSRVDLNGYNRAVSEAFVAELLGPQILEKAIKATGAQVNVESKRSLLDDLLMRDASRHIFTEVIEHDGTHAMKLALHDVAVEQKGVAGKTAWSLLQGITRYVDHTAGRTDDSRLTSAWFGNGNNLKQNALELAIEYTNALTR